MMFEHSQRLEALPPYLFAKIDAIKQQELKKGRSLISLSIGDPDLPTPDFILDRMAYAIQKPENHQYPSYWGMMEFRKTASQWCAQRFGIAMNPETEVLTLIGSKEGIAHLPLAFINPGEGVLIPDPAYPAYTSGTLFAGGSPLYFSLRSENQFLPDFGELEQKIRSHPQQVKLLFLNYPNNPTTACASLDFFKEVVSFAKKHQIMVCHDNAYSELYFDGKAPPSFLEVPGAKDIGCEFHSLSKTFNMTGWRVGFVIGNSKILAGLAQVKTNLDSGVFNACQEAAIAALEQTEPFCSHLRNIYQKRRDILVPALKSLGLQLTQPLATIYAWAKLPAQLSSEAFVMDLIARHGIICTPGNGFGQAGEGYVRWTLCSDETTLYEVAKRLKTS